MKKTTTKQNKIDPLERIAIALETIVAKFEVPQKATEQTTITNQDGYITFPEKTAKEIVDECSNEITGRKLVWQRSWIIDQDFYTNEKCRTRTIKIPTEILYAGKTWDECKELIGEEKMFNYAEIIYMLRESESFRKLLDWNNSVCYTWTSSRASVGRLAIAGNFDSGGVNSHGWRPRSSASDMGVCLSRS